MSGMIDPCLRELTTEARVSALDMVIVRWWVLVMMKGGEESLGDSDVTVIYLRRAGSAVRPGSGAEKWCMGFGYIDELPVC